MWSIRVLSGQQTGHIYDLKLGKNTFGRGGVSDLKIQSLGISKEHCEIHVYKDKMMIVDLKSSNGTFVNGVKIQNSIIRIGDKVSLFDVILDIIPMQDTRPKGVPKAVQTVPNPPAPVSRRSQNSVNSVSSVPNMAGVGATNYPTGYPTNYSQSGSAALQMSYQQAQAPAPAATPSVSFQQKVENYIENVLMPVIYKLGIIFSLKQILLGFIIIFIFMVTILSTIPLTNIIKESNLDEASKRAKSVAKTMANYNSQLLLSGQLSNLSVQEALKEEGIKEAFIIQQSDGLIVAPPEKAGREDSNPMVLVARRELRATFKKIDSNTIGASFPISIYDPSSGEQTPKYHAIVTYDVSALNFDNGRVISLFMQSLVISSILGMILYFLFARLIEFPIKNLNLQINKALLEKSDRVEVAFDYPIFQQLVLNVNTVLNRVWSGARANDAEIKPQQNKDLEFSNLVEIIAHPAIVIDSGQQVIALNSKFEQLAQTSADVILNQSYQVITDNALVQNIESLIARSIQSPFEKQMDRIPFSQFECEVYCQAFLNLNGEPQYFVLTLVQVIEVS